MHIHQLRRSELEALASCAIDPWLAAAVDRLLELPDHPRARVLAASDDDTVRAILGLELTWDVDGRLRCATIKLIEVDPENDGPGLAIRLIRFAEGITRLHRCNRVCVASDLDDWGGGRCRDSLGSVESVVCRARDVNPPKNHRSCA